MEKREWYAVDAEDNYYGSMVGYKVWESEKTIVLEFRFGQKLGGIQRVQFFKEQLIFDGEY